MDISPANLINNSDNPYVAKEPAKIPAHQENFLPQEYDKPAYEDIRQSYAADANPLISKKNSCHFRSFFATMVLIGGIVAPLVIYFKQPGDLTQGATIGICVGSYVLYLLIACICNDLNQYLSNITEGGRFENQYERTRGIIGRFRFYAECYHYQTRFHTRTVRDSDGNTRTQTYTTTEKVITHTATQYVTPSSTIDESGNVDRIRAQKNIVFIHFKINYRFFDDYSRQRHDQLFYSFKMRNTRDSNQDFSSIYETPGLIEKMAFFVGNLNCSYGTWFYIFGIFGLVWPYSLWVQSKIQRFDVFFMKVLKM